MPVGTPQFTRVWIYLRREQRWPYLWKGWEKSKAKKVADGKRISSSSASVDEKAGDPRDRRGPKEKARVTVTDSIESSYGGHVQGKEGRGPFFYSVIQGRAERFEKIYLERKGGRPPRPLVPRGYRPSGGEGFGPVENNREGAFRPVGRTLAVRRFEKGS